MDLLEATWGVGPDGRTIFALGKTAKNDELIGVMDNAELAECVVNRHNGNEFSPDRVFYRSSVVADYIEYCMYEKDGSWWIEGHKLSSGGGNSDRWIVKILRQRKSGWVNLSWVDMKFNQWGLTIDGFEEWCDTNGKEGPLEIQVQD